MDGTAPAIINAVAAATGRSQRPSHQTNSGRAGASAGRVRDPSWVSAYGADHIAFWQAGDRAIRAIW